MKLQGKIPVEQLEEERLTNIERKLVVAVSDMQAPPERASRRMLAFAGMTMAVAVAGFVGYKLRPDAPGPGNQPTVEQPQRFAIHTSADTKSQTLDLGDAQLVSGLGTDVVVERTRDRVVVQMQRGSLDLTVKHDPSRMLVVRAGDTEILDIGTHFVVDYDGKDDVAVRVTEGEVEVKRAGKRENIAAGFGWTTDTGKLALAQLDAAAATAVAVAPTPDPTLGSHVPQVPTVQTPVVAPNAGSATPQQDDAAGSGSGAGSGSVVVRKGFGKSNARVALEKLAIEEPLDVGTKELSTAIAKYLEMTLSMKEGEDKTQVLYSMAVMQHRARQDNAALYTLSAVIKRQGGKAYKSALWLNVRIECMQKFDDECRQAADLYLRKVPDGVAAGVAQTILTEIARQ